MTGSFGDPVYAGGDNGAATGSDVQIAGAQESVVDINDPRLTSEAVDEDVSQDAYAVPPPPPDGKWRAKLKAVDIKDAKGTPHKFIATAYPGMADGRPFLACNVEVALIDLGGKNDNIKLTEYHVKTLVDERKGVSQASTIATKAGAKVPPRATDADRMRILLDVLAREPEVIVETHWEATCQSCEDRAKKAGGRRPRAFQVGMHRFPQPRPGVFDPFVSCPTCKTLCRAQARIGGFMSVAEAKPTQGLGQAVPHRAGVPTPAAAATEAR